MGRIIFKISLINYCFILLLLWQVFYTYNTFAIPTFSKPLIENENVPYADHVFVDHLKSVQLYGREGELSLPLLKMNDPQSVIFLNFDDIKGGFKSYCYSVEQCNADWTPTDLYMNEYFEGTPFDLILNNKPSFNTLTKYTHYSLTIPNNNCRLKKSGNYILKVFSSDDKESILFSKKFYVVENQANVGATIRQASRIEYRNQKQEVDITLNTQLPISDAIREIKLVVKQNNRFDNEITDLQPLFINGNNLVYDYDFQNLFNGGNEFYQVDLRSTRIQGQGVWRIEVDSNIRIAVLPIENIAFKRYLYFLDANGKYALASNDNRKSENEKEYINVKFFLTGTPPQENKGVYVFGQLTNWEILPEAQMSWDPDKRWYEGNLLLKQGFYNFTFVTNDGLVKIADETSIVGNHFETENDYQIYAYYRPLGSNYDRLIGVSFSNSLQITR